MHQNPPSTYSSQMNINLQFPEHEHLNCPRCDSNNTKFCYYNNYNLSQPRHYCKNCRRYWTKGGTLRKIPIGGTTRKTTKRSSTSNKRPDDDSSTVTAPPAQLTPEAPAVSSFSDDRSRISGGSFDSSLRLNDLTTNLTGGSENGAADMEVFRLKVNSDRNQSGESVSSFNDDRSRISGGSCDSSLRLNDITPNLTGGSENGAADTAVFRLNVNGDRNQSGESSGCDGGGNGWPNLSIFTSGSEFR